MVTESNAGMVSSFADCSSRPLTDGSCRPFL